VRDLAVLILLLSALPATAQVPSATSGPEELITHARQTYIQQGPKAALPEFDHALAHKFVPRRPAAWPSQHQTDDVLRSPSSERVILGGSALWPSFRKGTAKRDRNAIGTINVAKRSQTPVRYVPAFLLAKSRAYINLAKRG
jgi:hypothetical protein